MDLVLTDKADGTGVTAVVSGAGGGTVVVYALRFEEALIAAGFAAVASRSSNGTVNLPLASGFWWVYADDGTTRTTTYGVKSSTSLDKPPTRCRGAIATRIVGMNLPGLGTKVYEQIFPSEIGVMYPCVILTIEGTSETKGSNDTTAADEIGYPTKVMIADRLNNAAPDHNQLPKYEAWRYAIERAFSGQLLPGVPECEYCATEPFVIADPMLPQYQHFVTGLTIRSFCRVPRGSGV